MYFVEIYEKLFWKKINEFPRKFWNNIRKNL